MSEPGYTIRSHTDLPSGGARVVVVTTAGLEVVVTVPRARATGPGIAAAIEATLATRKDRPADMGMGQVGPDGQRR